MHLISSRLHVFALSPVSSIPQPHTTHHRRPTALCPLFSLERVFQHCLSWLGECKKAQTCVILNLSVAVCNWREQGNTLPEARSWKGETCSTGKGRWGQAVQFLCSGWETFGLGDKRPLCSWGVCRTWQARVSDSFKWSQVRSESDTSQSKSREGKLRVSPSVCPVLLSNSVVNPFFFRCKVHSMLFVGSVDWLHCGGYG